MLGPVLFVGCGGSGGKTLRVARAALERRFRRAGFPPGFMPDAFQFIHVDVPPKQEGSVSEFGPYLPGESYVNLVDPGVAYSPVDDALVRMAAERGALQEMVGWRPDPTMVKVAIQAGAGQYRALGRLITLRRMNHVFDAVGRSVKAFNSADAQSELDAVSTALGWPVPASAVTKPGPLAIVVSSMAGGTGAGCFLDVCDILRSAYPGWGDHALSILYAPDVFSSVAGTEGVQANALASLNELLAGYWSNEQRQTELLRAAGLEPRPLHQGGAAHPFLIGSMNLGGVTLTNPQQVYRAMGEALAMIAAGSNVRENVVNFLTVNWQSTAERNPDSLGLSPPNTMAPISSFGYARAGLGRERFEEYVIKRLVRDAGEFMSTGYLGAAQNMFPGKELTPSEALSSLVEHLSVRFFSECGLHERDENNQVLDALTPAELEDSWQHVRRSVLNDISPLSAAAPTVWTSRIMSAVDPYRVGFQVNVEAMLAATTRTWVETSSGQVTSVVSSYSAKYGVPVARALVENLIAELRSVADQLTAEAQRFDQPTQWDSLVSAQLPAGRQQITGDNPGLVDAVRQGAGPLWSSAQSMIRRRAVEGMLELADGFLRPLLIALTAAQNQLQGDLGPQANGEPPEIQSWPQGDTVPTWLQPSDIEFLLEPVTQYPEKFTDLIRRAVDDSDERAAGGALLAARHDVTTGGFSVTDRESVPPAIIHGVSASDEVAGKWQPKVCGMSGTPATFRVDFSIEALLERARAWVGRPGTAMERYLHESLSDYLAERDSQDNPIINHTQRLAEFRLAFGNALRASSPLVLIDPGVYSQVHLGKGEPSVATIVEPIPFDESHPARPLARELLIARRVDPANVDGHFGTGSGGSISIISYLEEPSHPVVYRSLMEPIGQAWAATGGPDAGERFWKWCRTRPLGEAVPVPAGVRKAMIRGWFTARLLGMLDFSDPDRAYRITLDDGRIGEFGWPLLGARISSRDNWSPLAAVLESLGLALVRFSAAGQQGPLEPYRRLRQLGMSDVAESELSYNYLNPELDEFLTAGTSPHVLGSSIITGTDRAERLSSLIKLLHDSVEAYRTEDARPVTPLGFFGLHRVHELAAEAADCLEAMANAASRDAGKEMSTL
ncbi:tubulin-like doman-containing protein [Aquihabitans sp. McL0605]|uniref:tubulin-like doman-containing protein n=1 Tax=Aquihabitans sp. McL0605 TaxID=3415671 RepID=UPI003CEED3DB